MYQLIQINGFLIGCILHFLTVSNSWLRQQISKKPSLYKVSLRSFRWNDEGKQAVKTKAECFKAWRLFLFSSLFLSNRHYWPSVRSIWLDIWPNSFFCILLDFLKVFIFFLVGYATRLLRSLGRCATLCLETRFAQELMKGQIVASLAFCLPIRSRGQWKKVDASISHLHISHNTPYLLPQIENTGYA